MAHQAINIQEYRFPANGPYYTGISVKTEVTINATGSSTVVTNDAADADTDFTSAMALACFKDNAKANSATRLYVKNSDISGLSGLGYTYIGHVSATNVGPDPESFTLVEAASLTIPVDTKLYSATFAPMLNGRIFDTISGASSAVSGVEISTVRGEICVVVNYS
jgi:NADPH:quinone reductase-like Zn-dependent oxidoreductase